jgi:hypothetical protein
MDSFGGDEGLRDKPVLGAVQVECGKVVDREADPAAGLDAPGGEKRLSAKPVQVYEGPPRRV